MTLDSIALARVRSALLRWYDDNRRDLPWRAAPGERPDPYAVWVSEAMLQQTRVETVRPYFAKWLESFPNLETLAAAPEDSVLKAWEGLGYYSRARNLHRAVREVVARYGGAVPADIDSFRALPGVGRYTAGAVASIAFGQEAPVVDGNVRRVFARMLDKAEPGDARLWRLAERMVVGERPGDLNQALMELGAIVCVPRSPRCDQCPVRTDCAALSAGTVDERPARRPPKRIPVERHGVAVVVRDGRVLLTKRPDGGRLAGLWEFPGALRQDGEEAINAARRALANATDPAVTGAVTRDGARLPARRAGKRSATGSFASSVTFEPLCEVSHAFTHVRVVYGAYLSRTGPPLPPMAKETVTDRAAWIHIARIGDYALPRAQRKIAESVMARYPP